MKLAEAKARELIEAQKDRFSRGIPCVLFYDTSDGKPTRLKSPEFVFLLDGWEEDWESKQIAIAAYKWNIPIYCESGTFSIEDVNVPEYVWPNAKTIKVKSPFRRAEDAESKI